LLTLRNMHSREETMVENNRSSTDTKIQLEQDGINSEPGQAAGPTVTDGKMEDEISNKDPHVTNEQKGCSNNENQSSPAEMDQLVGKVANAQTPVNEGEALDPKGDGKSLGLPSSTGTPEKEDINTCSENQDWKVKVSPAEAQKRRVKVEQDCKQQANDLASKVNCQNWLSQIWCRCLEALGVIFLVFCMLFPPFHHSDMLPGEGVVVYFHAVVSKDFGLNPKQHKVFIRSESLSQSKKWDEHICELNCAKDLGEHGHLVEGCVTISKAYLNKSISYKYYIEKDTGDYEFIYKHDGPDGIVNRYMCIHSNKLSSGEWHQYDDIVCCRPPDGWRKHWKEVKEFIKMDDPRKRVVNGKYIAAEVMLDTIFSILTTWTPVNMKSFFHQMLQFYTVTVKPMVFQGGPTEWSSLQFGEKQVSTVAFLDSNSAHASPKDVPVKSKLGLGLIILVLGEEYELQTSKDDLSKLCSLLCLKEMQGEAGLHEMNFLTEIFSDVPRYVVFTLRLEKGSRMTRKMRKPTVELLQLMKKRKYLLDRDRFLGRAWFCFLPLEDLAEFLSDLPVVLLDALLGVYYRLKDIDSITYTNVEVCLCLIGGLFLVQKYLVSYLLFFQKIYIFCQQEQSVLWIAAYCFHHDSFEKLDPAIGKSFENCAIEAVNAACQSKTNLLDMVSSYNLCKLGKLVSAVITKSWKKDKSGKSSDDFDEVLNHLLTWPDIKHLFNINGTFISSGRIVDQLTDEAKDLMATVDSVFLHVAENLMSGSIPVKHLELIIQHQKQFMSVCELSKCVLLEWRKEEILSVKSERNWVGALLEMCRKVQTFVIVDTSDVDQKYSENLSLKTLDDVVAVRQLTSPRVDKIETYFTLSPELKEMSQTIYRLKDSHVFQYCWEREAQKMMGESEDQEDGEDILTLQLDEVYHDLFSPCYHDYQGFYNKLKCGELTFSEVDTLFNVFINHYEDLKTDFKIMCQFQSEDNWKWIDQRIQQIQQYHELHLAVDSAMVIAKVKDCLSLSGDFKILLFLLNLTDKFESFKEEKLSSINPALMDAKKLLQGITEPRRRCLEELALRRDFVNWVREALTDINELKVFVDLASISAGENDMDVDRVACFHDAVLGYASLLYELKRESGFEAFMRCLTKLWKALDSDCNLHKKLRDSARHLQWLKTVKESHGSVELSSLSLATAINTKGLYMIRAPTEAQKASLDTVLCLSLPELHGDTEEMRTYSLEELRELLNKLMLMSGRGDQGMEVETFSEVFSNVQRLALSFIDLYSAGNMLFRSWEAKVYCSPNTQACISMDFHLKPVRSLVGKGNVTKVLPALCREMESFLERWKCFMCEKRSLYFYLNYYTAEQLVYLCRELGKQQLREDALMMLSFIKHNCTKQDIRVASKLVVPNTLRKNVSELSGHLDRERDLTAQLKHVWEYYMECTSSFLPGYLDINTLGSCLASLADMDKKSVVRVLPQGLCTGQPNLVICPRSEVLVSALSIYMNSPDQTLPTYDEVLLCTPQTNFEQVALFLRRCLTPGYKGEKIYTMLYADELGYEVSYRLEELFQRLRIQCHKDDYRLVILCNCEREHCYIPSVFSQYKVHMIPLRPLEEIQRYLGYHYKVKQCTISAASVFKDNMCVGIVSSNRAGVGKSLYVKRLHEALQAKMCDREVPLKTIRMIEPQVDESKVLRSLLPFLDTQYQQEPMIFHFDITSSVQRGIPEFLFKLLILQYLADTDGRIWLRQPYHLYVVEILEVTLMPKKQRSFRCVEVLKWFHNHSRLLLKNLERDLGKKSCIKRNTIIWSLVLSVGVCYHASLEKKEPYRKAICKILPKPYDSPKGMFEEIDLMQYVFLRRIFLRDTIAKNLALKENVFMMVICIELKIPLFLVGKPGSSKSLAKTIVADAMQGKAAYSNLYKELKQIHLVSFQCSPHSTPEGIIGTFKHCARFQDGKNLREYVSVVVLDEIGLAEDSPKMPLKTLHPLLEDGCIDDEPLPHKKVGFIGISNWALDPAKMNRGIFVSRGDPSNKELIESAKGICSSDHVILQKVERFFPIFANAYEEICKTQGKEFFGLRDYYSLIKMVFALTKTSKTEPTPYNIAQVVLRNFSGKDDVNALDVFISKLPEKGERETNINTIELLQQNIYSESQDGECRYLLILTENYAALQILQQSFFTASQQPEIIFGSSFPKDQEYTQICRNINRVKICMETGQMVVLLNLQNLYESLYDALNQYYVYLAGQKYVDLGLGTHRVKCRVHPKFRLIVIEEKDVVYKHFPIPLINRLEKHYLDINIVLDKSQRDTVERLKKWVNDFTAVDTEKHLMGRQKYSPPDVFVGYHSDTCSSVVLQVTEKLKQKCSLEELVPKVEEEAKLVLLNCATPDSVVRLGSSRLGTFTADDLAKVYFQKQQHTSLGDFLHAHICAESRCCTVFTEITTFSRLMTAADSESLEAEVKSTVESLKVLFLQQFDTEHSFLKEIRNFLDATAGNKILIIQTDFEDGSLSAQLVASAKYSAVNEINKVELGEVSVFVYFITKLPRIEGGSSYVGFHGGLWQSAHIDDLRRSKDMLSDVTALRNVTISQLFCEDVEESEEVETAASESKEWAVSSESICFILSQVLDTTILLRSCVQSAVGMLRDQDEGACRSTKRIEILLGLLSKDDDLKASFLEILKNRLFSLLKKQEESSVNTLKDWVVREASNLSALQEAGTFRHTLWKRVQSAVIPFLAHMVSVIDRDCNLELLVRPATKDCIKNLWMFIFKDLKLLNIPYVMGNSSSQAQTILVQNYMRLSADAGNEMPFSWRIKDYLEELWAQAQYITTTEGESSKFVDIFQMTPLGQFISNLPEEERNILFHCYIRDFILLTLGVSSSEEFQLLQLAFLSCKEELKVGSVGGEGRMLSLCWIHLAYHQFRSRLQNFSRILAVNPSVLNALIQQVEEGRIPSRCEMVLDVFAALACTEMLEEQVLKIWLQQVKSTEQQQIWLQQVKNLHMPIELVCAENYLQGDGGLSHQLRQEVRIQWNRVFCMSLFVEHVLLGTDSLLPELQGLVKAHTSLLGKCFQGDSDIKTHKTFSAVVKVLCQCKDAASSTICRYGLKPCPICLGDPKDPVNLPCDHVYCQSCIKQWLVPGQMLCPFCRTDLPDDYIITTSQDVAIEKNAQFRQRCNGFFIDLVSTMCFKDNVPPEKAVIKELLSLLFVQKEILKVRQGDFRTIYTKSLSPFDDIVDKTPIIRSVVLKLLLKYSFRDVKGYMQKYLSQVEQSQFVEKDDKTELYMLFVNCLEDSMYEKKTVACSEDDRINHLREDGRFLGSCFQGTLKESSIEYLQGMARVRLCMDRAAELLFELHRAPGKLEGFPRTYLQKVMRFFRLARNDWYRVYLVRKLTNQYGMEFTQRLTSEDQSQWIFPEEIIEQQVNQTRLLYLLHQAGQIDRYLACGKNYRLLPCNTLRVCLTILLLLYLHVNVCFQQCHTIHKFIQSSKVLASPDRKKFATSLVANNLPSLAVSPQTFSHNGTIIEMAIHTAALLLCGQNRILEPLRKLAFSPEAMQHSYLPTMPEDLLSQAVKWQGLQQLHWFGKYSMFRFGKKLLGGSYCFRCGRPMELGTCVDCQAPIGGQNHMMVQGFTTAQTNMDRTQTGHVLGNPCNREATVTSERAMSPVVLILIRLLTHLAMLLGSTNNPQSMQRIIKPLAQDPVSFLLQHIQKDLEQLMNTLGKSADETTNVVHLLLCCLLKESHQHTNQFRFDDTLSTKEHRENWEGVVANTIIIPELTALDKTLLEVNQQISEDERMCSNPVAKIVYGDPATFLSQLSKDSAVHCSRMWSCRKRISVEYLGHVVQQKGGKDNLPILWKFLQKEAELRLVKFLPEILALQKDLVRRFQNVTEMEHKTIRDFLNSIPSDGMRNVMQSRVEVFLSAWNKLRRSLDTNGEIKLPKDYCDADCSLESEFEILLPRRRGLGLCSTALASYLISLHNDFVYTVENYTTDASSYSVSPVEVTDLHVIGYEVERDLVPLILSNCQYSMEKGGEALQEFDLEKIQQQVTTRFLQGKPLITLTGMPTLVYRHDRNYEYLFNNVKSKLTQSSLPNTTINMISGELQSYTDICEALQATEIVLGFLAMAGEDPDMPLINYIQDILQMGNQMSLHVLKALSRCHLKHSIALWQLLSTRKSEQMLCLKRDPFVEVGTVYKTELTEENAKALNTFLVQTGLEIFLQELHEMILLKLKHTRTGDEFNPVWSLKETFVPYIESKDSNVLTELEDMFPEEIKVSQCIAVWKAAAALKRDRRLS
uniref:Ring finger protein 213 n=1 Tax=Sphenodon punctatus TaxID=8508 RepID=A0A8D0H1U9_SPHPU